MYVLRSMQLDETDTGYLELRATSSENAYPIDNLRASISYTGDPESAVTEVTTNESGQTEPVELAAPPIEYSLDESFLQQPYSEYSLFLEASGYEPVEISGVQILADTTALQNIALKPLEAGEAGEVFVIPAHTLYGEYPPKIPEAEIKPIDETGEIVLSRVVVPEYIVVHDGSPRDPTAINYYVRYRDYIKNVASSEIYATWPDNTIRANVLAIMSFTLNRVYTEWYRNMGYDFTITSSTAYDHKWIPNRNIYTNISNIVDELFAAYLSRPNVRQPILTQYCDGRQVSCPNWMTQWGSKSLGEQGYSTIDILRYYYGDNLYINYAEEISGIPSSWPGQNLTIGSSGAKVRQMQEQLNTIANGYPAVPRITADGVYGPATAESVRVFQSVFGLPVTGIVDYPTWYKISEVYVGVSRIGELS